MHRIQPKELLAYTPEEEANLKHLEEKKERSKITSFSWTFATKFFEERTRGRTGKAAIYFLDGHQIEDETFITCVTAEICREYGFELLDVLADLILPVGFGYTPLNDTLNGIVEDAFKPVSRTGLQKTIVWIEDEYWNNLNDSLVEPVMRQFLLTGIEPFLLAPMKYFDKEVLSTVFKVMGVNLETNPDPDRLESSWQTFNALLKFGFLLALRSTTYPVIVIHFGQKLAEKVDGFRFLDLAKAEGHEVKYFKNTLSSPTCRDEMIANFVERILSPGSPNKKLRVESGDDVKSVAE